ncbi:hypothetical protein GOBAR_DD04508 [Gossypium barbadense]|nr:hypothetical protein GOBAR_DD04508 [Gossypium barbadense]
MRQGFPRVLTVVKKRNSYKQSGRDICNFKLSLAEDLKAQEQFKIIDRVSLLVIPRDITIWKVFKYCLFDMGGCGYTKANLVEGAPEPWNHLVTIGAHLVRKWFVLGLAVVDPLPLDPQVEIIGTAGIDPFVEEISPTLPTMVLPFAVVVTLGPMDPMLALKLACDKVAQEISA